MTRPGWHHGRVLSDVVGGAGSVVTGGGVLSSVAGGLLVSVGGTNGDVGSAVVSVGEAGGAAEGAEESTGITGCSCIGTEGVSADGELLCAADGRWASAASAGVAECDWAGFVGLGVDVPGIVTAGLASSCCSVPIRGTDTWPT